jgi:uncharacterized membrane protein
MKPSLVSLAALALLLAGSKAQAQTIDLDPFSGQAFCGGTEPFWSLDYEDGEARWSSFGSDGWLEFPLSGTFRVAGAAYGPIAVWRGNSGEEGEGDYVLVAEPAEIEISESDDFLPTHMAVVVTPRGDLMRGTCSLPARAIGW